MKRIFQYLLPYKKKIVIIILVSITASIFSLANTWFMGRLTEAIFYRTKGIELSLNWDRAPENKEFTFNITPKEPFSGDILPKIKQDISKFGLTVKKIIYNDGVLLVSTLVPSGMSDQPLKLADDLEKSLKKKYGSLDVYVALRQTSISKRNILFPKYYTVFVLPVLVVIVYLLLGISRYTKSYMIESMGQKIVMRLRNEIYANLHNLSLSYFEKNKSGQTGQLISRLIGDIGIIQFLFTSGIFDMMLEPIVIIFGIIWAFMMNWQLTMVFFLVIPLLVWPISYLTKKLRDVNLDIMNTQAEITGVLEEALSAIKVIKAFGMEDYEINRFEKQNMQNYRVSMRGTRVGRMFTPIIEFLVSIALAILLTYGGYLVIGQKVGAGEFFAFVVLISTIAEPMKRISGVFNNIPRSIVAAKRVFELIDAKSEIVEVDNPIVLNQIKGKVQFKNVSFSYEPNNPVLKHINLDVEPGEVIAFVGPSGSGKTTMVNLVARFYDPISGAITVDGHDLRGVKVASLRRQMGMVLQESVLFRGTIAENIAYGKIDANLDEVVAAAKAANAHEFIEKMPDGYQTKVGAKGWTLSGGQRQRIAIARAILRDPRILILDEATSALDTQSEILVQEALQRLMCNRTSFVIAHRLSTIRSASRIVVMNQGEVVEIGRHEDLLEKNGLYAMLYRTQLQKQQSGIVEED